MDNIDKENRDKYNNYLVSQEKKKFIRYLLDNKVTYFDVERVNEQEMQKYLKEKYTHPEEFKDPNYVEFHYSVLDRFRWYEEDKETNAVHRYGEEYSVCIGIGHLIDLDELREEFYAEIERRNKYKNKKQDKVMEVLGDIQENYIRKENLFICPNCGENCETKFRMCPYCEFKFATCEICKAVVKPEVGAVACPKCDRLFHDIHFREFLKIKGECPTCREKINPEELVIVVNGE